MRNMNTFRLEHRGIEIQKHKHVNVTFAQWRFCQDGRGFSPIWPCPSTFASTIRVARPILCGDFRCDFLGCWPAFRLALTREENQL